MEREPRQDRSRATRARLLDATIALLARDGWGAFSVGAVAERAGVSRGATQHHFPTREDLLFAALESVFDRLTDAARDPDQVVPDGPDRTRRALAAIVGLYLGPTFAASLQVWTAAAADPALRERLVPLERRFGRAAYETALRLLRVEDADRDARRLVQATLDFARGLGLADTLSDDSQRRERMIDVWAAQLEL